MLKPGGHVQKPVSVLVFFCNFLYYIFLLPTRFKWDQETKQYFIVSNKLQSIICGCFHLLEFHDSTVHVVIHFLMFQKLDRSLYLSTGFLFSCYVAGVCLMYQFLQTVWLKRNAFADLVNSTTTYNLKMYTVSKWLVGAIGVGYIIQECVGDYLIFNSYLEWGQSSNFPDIIPGYPWQWFLKFIASQSEPIPFLWYSFHQHSARFTFFIHLFFVAVPCSLLAMSKDFQHDVGFCDLDTITGIKACRSLKRKIDAINNMFGGQVLGLYVVVVAFYVIVPDLVTKHQTFNSSGGRLTSYFISNTLTWIVAAEFHSSICRTISKWHGKRFYDELLSLKMVEKGNLSASLREERMMLMSIKQELHAEPIALSTPFFSITPTFLCSMLGLLVTYGIIIFQLGNC